MNDVILTPGFIGISQGESSSDKQAIIWGGEEEFYFYPVTENQADRLLDWYSNNQSSMEIASIMFDISTDDLAMFTGDAFPIDDEDDVEHL